MIRLEIGLINQGSAPTMIVGMVCITLVTDNVLPHTDDMALFIRRQDNDNQLFRVTRDLPKQSEGPADGGFVSLVFGLGNIGAEYQKTRHNSGFLAVDMYREQLGFPDWQEKTKFKAYTSEGFLDGKKVILAKPTTLYNRAGESVRAIKDFYKLTNSDIVVIHDELDLAFGTVKQKVGGGSAGSNGLKSIISHIGADFKRVRIGIRNDQLEHVDPADFVLSRFSSSEKSKLDSIINAAVGKIEL